MFHADLPPPAPPLPPGLRDLLREVYRRLDLEVRSLGPACWIRGDCCDFERQDHVLYASSLEVAHACAEASAREPESRERLCPFWIERRCHNREGRPLGCRTYFCDPRYRAALEDIHERHLREVRKLAELAGYPSTYSPFPAAARRTLAAEPPPARVPACEAAEGAGRSGPGQPSSATFGAEETRS